MSSSSSSSSGSGPWQQLRGSSSSSSRSSGSTSSTSSRHGAKLPSSLGNQLLNVLASELSNNLVNLFTIGLDTNRAEDALDVGSGGFSTSEGGEEGSSNVTHDFKSVETRNGTNCQISCRSDPCTLR
eukprot:TRINITY_DN24872_c0_g1_i1.p1 TRINITY_DN24872_c0_g1~~TRINITY_DN24872_c0_g1_i1.p1  ORF type:complete len:127 (-),score=20.37 TRINITY_DN24872_c0_g1_i1:39-419(-)